MNTRRSRCANPAQSGSASCAAISAASCGDTHSSASTKYTQSWRISGSRSAHSRCAEKPSQGCSTTSAPSERASGTVRVCRAGVHDHDLVRPRHRGQAPADVRLLVQREHDDAHRDAARRRIIAGLIWPQAQPGHRGSPSSQPKYRSGSNGSGSGAMSAVSATSTARRSESGSPSVYPHRAGPAISRFRAVSRAMTGCPLTRASASG